MDFTRFKWQNFHVLNRFKFNPSQNNSINSAKMSANKSKFGQGEQIGRLFKALGDNLFGPNRPSFWRFYKVGQNLKFLCYKIIIIAVNFQKNIFLKF